MKQKWHEQGGGIASYTSAAATIAATPLVPLPQQLLLL